MCNTSLWSLNLDEISFTVLTDKKITELYNMKETAISSRCFIGYIIWTCTHVYTMWSVFMSLCDLRSMGYHQGKPHAPVSGLRAEILKCFAICKGKCI